MPVLKKEVSVQPADLFESENEPEESAPQRPWMVLHTRPRAEKAVVRKLLGSGASFFLPLYERRYRRQRRTIRSFVPLFPGYVFVKADDDERNAIFKTNQVVGCLPVRDQKRLYSDLLRIYQLIQSEFRLAPEDRLEPGMPAEIVGGPMRGYRGTVVRRSTGLRFVIEVDFLQRGASVEIESSDIRPV